MISLFHVVLSILLPISLGILFRFFGFTQEESTALRKFVIKVTVPFIVFRNLLQADLESLTQILPSVTAMILMTVLFSATALGASRFLPHHKDLRHAFIFSTFVGNYGYLGWGVMNQFYGDAGFTRAVFFTLFFWPVFLLAGFALIYLLNKKEDFSHRGLLLILGKNSAPPLLSAAAGLLCNLFTFHPPPLLNTLINQFAAMTVPLILFTIGLSFHFILKRSDLPTILLSCIHRLFLGYLIGLATCAFVSLFFSLDPITKKVILMESVMPTAAMAPFFAEHISLDKKVQASVITLSTAFSLLTIPLWYLVTEALF
ncbi:MAG TPA: AEC family transporter [Firmicutes bacterium]|nr:AEC family transporter [Bacillota bacterium]